MVRRRLRPTTFALLILATLVVAELQERRGTAEAELEALVARVVGHPLTAACAAEVAALRTSLGLDDGRRAVLYAPTFMTIMANGISNASAPIISRRAGEGDAAQDRWSSALKIVRSLLKQAGMRDDEEVGALAVGGQQHGDAHEEGEDGPAQVARTVAVEGGVRDLAGQRRVGRVQTLLDLAKDPLLFL